MAQRSGSSDARTTIAQIARRAGFGLAPGELDELEDLGVDAAIDRMVDPDAHGLAPGPADLWAGLVFPLFDTGGASRDAVGRWLDHLRAAPRQFEEWMAWYWHGHLVSNLGELDGSVTRMMTAQIELFRASGLGSFPALLRAVTIDPAMLTYLDGSDNSGERPNENYSRELLELFALGIGNYTEDDVLAGAGALSGWRVRLDAPVNPGEPGPAVTYFDPAGHDDTPRRYLGTDGVHDLDTLIDAVVGHPECPRFVASRFGRAVLGPDVAEEVLDELARRFAAADLDLRALARATLEAVADGHHRPLLLGPVPWLVALQRATGAELDADERYFGLWEAGQLPLWPPNVGGWPGGATWLASSTVAARFNLAAAVAEATPARSRARAAAAGGDAADLADALGRPEGFSESTVAALDGVDRSDDEDGTRLLTIALASPDLVVA